MTYIATCFLVGIGLTFRIGSSQLIHPSRQYIPGNSYQNHLNVLNPIGSFEQPTNPYSVHQRKAYSVLTDNPETDVVKSVYFYESSPQLQEESRIRIRLPPPKKKTRVIFIKAPETKIVHEIIPPRPTEERTVIYVLSKKLEPLGSITIPSNLVTTVRKKPEVYYIKYKDLKHAQQLLAETLKGRESGTIIPTQNNAKSFLNTLINRDNQLIYGKVGSVPGGFNEQAIYSGGVVSGGGYGHPGISGPY